MMGHSNSSIDRRRALQGFGAMLLATACGTEPKPEPSVGGEAGARRVAPSEGPLESASPESVGMSSARIADVFARLERRVGDELIPGFSAIIVRYGKIVGLRAVGTRVRGEKEPMTADTIFDLESMTKVISTAISALVLVDQGKLDLAAPVARYLPGFLGEGKDKVTVRDMLRYSSGLPLDGNFADGKASKEEAWRKMLEAPLEYRPGTSVAYSDLTYRLLGKLIEAAAGTGLDVFARENVWKPLGMMDTMYNPPREVHGRVAATNITAMRKSILRGVLQDDQDYLLGGVCGCDGVFSTAMDIAVFCQTILAGGVYNGKRILSPALAAEMVKNQTSFVSALQTDTSPLFNLVSTPKGYGWELFAPRFSTGGTRLTDGSYGKAGGAGTFTWVDPARQLFGVLLTNHGLPMPFEERTWNRLLDEVGCGEFFDGIVGAVTD